MSDAGGGANLKEIESYPPNESAIKVTMGITFLSSLL
ncbi:hypothetical protein PSHT_05252 [Puccinia striiformis]|uniref:Uncharacterized protein n=1 Tax=Puccinia striiformis TaxID=27350 RepID=A0A2S4WB42_9BASI|nr:hypothetical protein PSHT_05252 [Puccinia striiformis]